MYNGIKYVLVKLKQTGGHSIFAAGLINKLIAFINSIIVARILSKNDFGVYSYCYSIIQFFILLRGLGLNNSMLQFCSERGTDDYKRKIYKFAIKKGFIITYIISFLCVIFTFIFDFRIDRSDYYLRLLSFIPVLMFIRESYSMILRTKFRNKEYALTTNIDTVTNLMFPILCGWLFGLVGYIMGLYIAYIVSIYIERRFVCDDLISIKEAGCIDDKLAKSLLSYGIICCVTNAISQSLYLTDSFLIGAILQDSTVLADYKIATGIPFAFNFIPLTLAIYITPYYALHNTEPKWIKQKTYMLLAMNGTINVFIGCILLALADYIIPIIYGEQYVSAIPCFRVLVLSYIVSSVIKIPIGNILVMLRMVKYNLVTSCIEGGLNIAFDIILIRYYGAIGAAYATLLIAIASSMFAAAGYAYFLNKRGIKT